ncbi:hypothetical protein [Paenibacillus sp. DMB5]|uniref:hypothetical protein n=1 Tax=Paenibacillus sp. DMB5 TaxID=1780103 RepID=UPI00076D767F|nr:hypothetical protein [Paenibacillus sp. DMB5]KUP22380.1 hypothetical protein AWJ19_27565 [Paenibacillus sp. DMB5]
MMKDHAKFTGEIAKGIKIGESSVEVKLLIPLRAALPHLLFLSSNQGEEINVFLGDPQAAFNFDEEEEIHQEVTGRRVTTDASGVVTSVELREGDDPDQVTIFDQQPDGEEVGGSEQGDESGGEAEGGAGDSSEGGESAGEDAAAGDGDFQPNWIDEEQGGQEEEGQNDGSEAAGDASEVTGSDAEQQSEGDAEEDVDKEQLDEFILTDRPIFAEVEFDGQPVPFPDLLEKRLRENKTWREIALENGMRSGQLSSRYSTYRKLAAKKMKGGGGAA